MCVYIYRGVQVITNKSRWVIVAFRSGDRKLRLIYRGPEILIIAFEGNSFCWTIFGGAKRILGLLNV